MMTKFYALATVAASNAFLATESFAQATTASGYGGTACNSGSTIGKSFFDAILKFIGSPIFYAVMFLLALTGLYAAIVKQDSAGWWAVAFAAIGAASPNIFRMVVSFGCDIGTTLQGT
jgi:hypothetical protein